jgi:hypothetical protein
VDLQPLHESKGFTRATNAFSLSHDCPVLSTRILDRGLLAAAKSMFVKRLAVAVTAIHAEGECRFGDSRDGKTFCSLAHLRAVNYNVAGSRHGGVAERLKEAVLKTVRPERVSWVRIPPPPPISPGFSLCSSDSGGTREFAGLNAGIWEYPPGTIQPHFSETQKASNFCRSNREVHFQVKAGVDISTHHPQPGRYSSITLERLFALQVAKPAGSLTR